jgi:hypothetical protein
MGMLRICNEHDCHTKTLGSHCINHETPASLRSAKNDERRLADSADTHEPTAID